MPIFAGIAVKREAWRKAAANAEQSVLARLADAYVAAFLAPKIPDAVASVPLSGYLWGLANGQQERPELDGAAYRICRAHGVFHWWLAFPQVAAKGGFSVILGNPPWDMLQLDPQEFFSAEAPAIANAQHMAARDRLIASLEWERPHLFRRYWAAVRGTEAVQAFVHSSGRFPKSGFGRVNLASLFAETCLQAGALNTHGRVGLVLPSGIATDSFTQHLFNAIAAGNLVSLFDFENREGIFAGVHRSYKFCLLTMGRSSSARFQFFSSNTSHLLEKERQFTLTPADFELLNPNTRTCPVFRSNADAELTKKVYRATSVLWREAIADVDGKLLAPDVNPWGVRFQLMFMMNTDSNLFRGGPAGDGEPMRLPLYEAKMIHQFDHRWATYIDAPKKTDGLDTRDCTDAQKSSPDFMVRSRYWVEERQVLARIARVPSRVSTAWLALHTCKRTDIDAFAKAQRNLMLAVASWVAGEYFRRNAGLRNGEGNWTPTQQVHATQVAEMQLVRGFEPIALVLRDANIFGKKALSEFLKWAVQDIHVGLSDDELDALSSLCVKFHGIPGLEALLSLLDVWMDHRSPRWLLGWRDICRSTDERTVIATVLPRRGVGNKIPLLIAGAPISAHQTAALFGSLSSLTLDFVARQKVGGVTLNYFYMKQFPVLAPDRYSESDLAFIVARVLELTYTSFDLKPWAEDLGFNGLPFDWNPDRRAILRAELDAYYAHLYGLTRDELRYILDPADVMGASYPSETFRVLKNSETRTFGEYRTGRLVLDAWDRFASNQFVGLPYELPVSHADTIAREQSYSNLGIIRSETEGLFAGLVTYMLKLGGQMSTSALQSAIETASISEYAATLLNSDELNAFQQIIDANPGILLSATTARLNAILLRLENVGSVFAVRSDSFVTYRLTDEKIPGDVIQNPDLERLAGYILNLDSKRQARLAGLVSGANGVLSEKKTA